MKNIKHPFKKIQAFSLVEMFTVFAIIGVILAFTIPSIKAVRETTKKKQEKRQVKTSNAAELAVAQAAGDAAHLLMTVWNDAIIKGVVKREEDQGLAQIITLVLSSPSKFGLTDGQARLLKGAHTKEFNDLIVDAVTGQLVLVKSINSTASGMKPGPNGETPDRT